MTSRSAHQSPEPGHVAFVGAGPGDPGLLTLRAVEMLAEADVIVVDDPAHQSFLRHAADGAEVVEAVASDDGAPLTAAARSRLAVQAAKRGRRVARLLGGDPFAHPTGADEVLA